MLFKIKISKPENLLVGSSLNRIFSFRYPEHLTKLENSQGLHSKYLQLAKWLHVHCMHVMVVHVGPPVTNFYRTVFKLVGISNSTVV